jgi:hypothetical protein
MKVCSNCKIEKELTEFHFRNDKNIYRAECKECRKKKGNEYNIKIGKNSFKMLSIKNLLNEGLKKCPKCNIIKNINLFKNQSDKPSGKSSHCKDCIKIKNQKNKEIIKEKNNIRYQKNKIEIIKQHNIYLTNKRKYNPLFKLRCNISSRIQQSLKRNGYTKNSKTNQILGCSFEEFKQYLQIQFIKGMTWENFGEWHLDHIYPVSLAKDEEELIRLNHYTNFQPLWAKDNLQKGNKIINNKQLKLL